MQWTDRDADTRFDLLATTGLVLNMVARHVPERLAEVLCLEAVARRIGADRSCESTSERHLLKR